MPSDPAGDSPDETSDSSAPHEATPQREAMRGRSRKGFRIVFAGYLVVTIAFIAITATVVTKQIFEAAVPSRGDRIPSLAPACESGLRELGLALDRGLHEAMWSDDEETATHRFQAGIAGAWKEEAAIERACSTEPAAEVAWAAMLRQRRIQEGWARRHARETMAAAGAARRFLPAESESAPSRGVSR